MIYHTYTNDPILKSMSNGHEHIQFTPLELNLYRQASISTARAGWDVIEGKYKIANNTKGTRIGAVNKHVADQASFLRNLLVLEDQPNSAV